MVMDFIFSIKIMNENFPDRRTNGQVEGGQTEGLTDEQTERQTTYGQIDGWRNRRTDGLIDGEMTDLHI